MRYRLVTRSDFDGLVCAVLLRHLDLIDDVTFVHPEDVQDGTVEITERDILTNLPYSPRAHLVFDHRHSEMLRTDSAVHHVIDPRASSTARVVWSQFGGSVRFPRVPAELIDAVDRAGSAAYDISEVLDPQGWTLMSFLLDSRTGLGRFQDFRTAGYQLRMELIEECLRSGSVEEILALPDVAERAMLYREQSEPFVAQLKRVSTVRGDVVVVDLRDEEVIHAGNRFVIYAMVPQARVSVHVLPGEQQQTTMLAVGKSIVDRSSPADMGEVMLRYGGGGHLAAGTCRVSDGDAERVLDEVVAAVGSERLAA